MPYRSIPPRPTVAGLALLIAAIGLVLAVERRVAEWHPEAALRRTRAAYHANEAETWRSVPESFRHHPVTRTPPPRYERNSLAPTGILADPRRHDATGRPWEYHWGSSHRWLGPADPERSEAAIRDDFFALCLEKAAFHDRMAAKWTRAARLPWLSVEPDPPGPPLVYDPPGDSW